MKKYIAIFQSGNKVDTHRFVARNMGVAKKYAQSFKKRTFEGRVSTIVKEYIKWY